jgi:hypothetical protein
MANESKRNKFLLKVPSLGTDPSAGRTNTSNKNTPYLPTIEFERAQFEQSLERLPDPHPIFHGVTTALSHSRCEEEEEEHHQEVSDNHILTCVR